LLALIWLIGPHMTHEPQAGRRLLQRELLSRGFECEADCDGVLAMLPGRHILASPQERNVRKFEPFVASVAETPFGSVKDSGYGREGGTEGLYCYTVAKNVSQKVTSP
jgi:hypothetical protein